MMPVDFKVAAEFVPSRVNLGNLLGLKNVSMVVQVRI